MCIPTANQCDGNNDCGNWADELDCLETTTTSARMEGCRSNEFRCDSGRCIPDSYKCDQRNDCYDWSDELNCQSQTTVRTTLGFVQLTVISYFQIDLMFSVAELADRGNLLVPMMHVVFQKMFAAIGKMTVAIGLMKSTALRPPLSRLVNHRNFNVGKYQNAFHKVVDVTR